ncbi:hypothetical protein [Streptomyces chryseus]
MADTLHISLTATHPIPPTPRTAGLNGRGGLGRRLIKTLAEQTLTVPDDGGKTVHAFLPW